MKRPEEVKKDNLRIRVSEQDKKSFMPLVEKYNTTIAGLIRIAIQEFIERNK